MCALEAPNRTSVYYQHTGGLPLASRLSVLARHRMFTAFMEYFRPGPATSVLDVGVTSDASFAESNYFERMYPHRDRITCVGTEDGSHLETLHPGIRYRRVTQGHPLPFADREFDVVVSNAVVEHTGGPASQRQFVREALRVSRAFFITTPNRWFPVEPHTGLPLLHYMPAPVFRWLIARTRYRYWADQDHLNILDARAFRALFPHDVQVEVRRVRLAGLASNLIALGRWKGERP